ncbi:MAG: hypothetical protein QW215_08850, partial [Ignisphaera sp.]
MKAQYNAKEIKSECENVCLMSYISSNLANSSNFERFPAIVANLYGCCEGNDFCTYSGECYSNQSRLLDAICLVNDSGSYWHDIDDRLEYCELIGGRWSNTPGKLIEGGLNGSCCGDDIGMTARWSLLDTWENDEEGANWCCCGGNVVPNATLLQEGKMVPQNAVCDYDADGNYELICVNGKYYSCIDIISGASYVAHADEIIGKYYCDGSLHAWRIAPTEAKVELSSEKIIYYIPDDKVVLIDYSVSPTIRSVVQQIPGTLNLFLINDSQITLLYSKTGVTPFSGTYSWDISGIRVEKDYVVVANFTYVNENNEVVNATSNLSLHIVPLHRINLTFIEPSHGQSFGISDVLRIRVNVSNTGVFDENVNLTVVVSDVRSPLWNATTFFLSVGESTEFVWEIPISESECTYNLLAFNHTIMGAATFSGKETKNFTQIYISPYIDVNPGYNIPSTTCPIKFGANEEVRIESSITSCSNFDILLNVSYEFKNIERDETVAMIYGCSGGNLVNSSSTKLCDFRWNTDSYKSGKYNITMRIWNESLGIDKKYSWCCKPVPEVPRAFDIEPTMDVRLGLSTDKDAYALGERIYLTVNLSNVGNLDVYRDVEQNTGRLVILILNRTNGVVDSFSKVVSPLLAGSSSIQEISIYVDPTKPYTGTNRILAIYNFTYEVSGIRKSGEVSSEKEIVVGRVAINLREPKKNAVFYIGEPILFDLSATTVNITTGEVEILDYASQQ